MSAFCLDTNAYIALRRGESAIGRQIESARWIGVSTIVLGELEGGFLNGSLLEYNRRRLNNFLEEPVVEILLSTGRWPTDMGKSIFTFVGVVGRSLRTTCGLLRSLSRRGFRWSLTIATLIGFQI